MSWIIVNIHDSALAWSNEFGWVEDMFDTFTDEQKQRLHLPIEGEWRQVPWRKAT